MDDAELFEVVSTVAGSGRVGFADGPVRDVYFDHPAEMCALGDGTVLVADTRNNCLRRVVLHVPPAPNGAAAVSSGEQVSVVETLMTNSFLAPRCPCPIDSGNAVVVCDSGHNKIRMLQLFSSDPEAAEAVPAIPPPLSESRQGFGALAMEGADSKPAANVAPSPIRWVQDSVIAGSGLRGFADGPVETATFNTPTGVCALRDGSLLVADSKNNAIRRVGTRPGRRELYVTTIVGGATAGFVDGDAVHARLNNPTSVAVDRHGTVIVVDTGNHAIRALHPPSGSNSRHGDAAHGWIVTTIAGGPQAGHTDGASAAALFRSPAAVSFMDDGRMLVADSGNNCVRCLRPGGLLSRRRGPAGELPVAPQGAGLGGASSDASSTTRGRMTVRGDVVDVIEEQQARAEYQALAFQELVQQQERERQRQLSGGGPASPTRQAAGSLSTHAPGVSEAYPSPGDIILAHRRYAYVSTVAGPRSPLTSSSPASRDVNAAKVAVVPRDGRYRDGYFCDARMRGPAGVCALPHSGGIVLVADGLNHFLRMLVPRAAIARPVATLRHLLPKTLLQYASNRSPADIAADAALGQGRVSDSSVASSAHAVRSVAPPAAPRSTVTDAASRRILPMRGTAAGPAAPPPPPPAPMSLTSPRHAEAQPGAPFGSAAVSVPGVQVPASAARAAASQRLAAVWRREPQPRASIGTGKTGADDSDAGESSYLRRTEAYTQRALTAGVVFDGEGGVAMRDAASAAAQAGVHVERAGVVAHGDKLQRRSQPALTISRRNVRATVHAPRSPRFAGWLNRPNASTFRGRSPGSSGPPQSPTRVPVPTLSGRRSLSPHAARVMKPTKVAPSTPSSRVPWSPKPRRDAAPSLDSSSIVRQHHPWFGRSGRRSLDSSGASVGATAAMQGRDARRSHGVESLLDYGNDGHTPVLASILARYDTGGGGSSTAAAGVAAPYLYDVTRTGVALQPADQAYPWNELPVSAAVHQPPSSWDLPKTASPTRRGAGGVVGVVNSAAPAVPPVASLVSIPDVLSLLRAASAAASPAVDVEFEQRNADIRRRIDELQRARDITFADAS